MRTFIERALDGETTDIDECIDNEIDHWHDSFMDDIELHEYLGMTWEEYAMWVENPNSLQSIIDNRRKNK